MRLSPLKLIAAIAPWLMAAAGLLALGFVAGTASAYFGWNVYATISKAFTGGEAWVETQHDSSRPMVVYDSSEEDHARVRSYGSTHSDGYVLIAVTNSRPFLIDENGKVVYSWDIPFSSIWKTTPHIPHPSSNVRVVGLHAYGNGDLLATYFGAGTPYGYGMAMVDKHSHVKWTIDKNIHHFFHVSHDGTIYAMSQEFRPQQVTATNSVPAILTDAIEIISPDGKPIHTIPLPEAFEGTPYAAYLQEFPPKKSAAWDVSHVNSITVIEPDVAPKFPMFPVGSIVLSVRNVNAIAVISPQTDKVIWAAKGPWQYQHNVTCLPNGHFLIFDNVGGYRNGIVYSRALEFDPRTGGIVWTFPRERQNVFFTPILGQAQRLENGNTLVLNPYGMQLMEVSPDGEMVWEYELPHVPLPFMHGFPATLRNIKVSHPADLVEFFPDRMNMILSAEHYSPGQLPFLNKE